MWRDQLLHFAFVAKIKKEAEKKKEKKKKILRIVTCQTKCTQILISAWLPQVSMLYVPYLAYLGLCTPLQRKKRKYRNKQVSCGMIYGHH